MPVIMHLPYEGRNLNISRANNPHPVATEEELLEFCNKVRQAGGVNILDALLPSIPTNGTQCLIANALNFGCEIGSHPEGTDKGDGSYRWAMILPYNMDLDLASKIAEAIGFPLLYGRKIELPEHIGNAAQAFDGKVAFQDFNVYNTEVFTIKLKDVEAA